MDSGVDGTVRRIATTYEVRGMKETITSYDNPAVGSGTVLNQCQFGYNDFGQLVVEYQSHDGAVNVTITPKVQYGYADGSHNTIRSTGLVYPNGRELTYGYGSSGGLADKVSRIASVIDDDSTHLVDYSYLGRGTFVVADSPQPQMKWTLVDLAGSDDPDTGDIYSGLDRFGRVKDNRCYNYDSEEDIDRIQYGYDRVGNRVWRHNVVAASLSMEFDELYIYDGVHRLKDMQRGTLATPPTSLSSTTFSQCWTLDSTGNWQGFREDDNGDGTWDLIQARTVNKVNEITDITNSVGSPWVEPTYSPVGNMTTMPQPNDLTQGFTATYDAWNRLVKLEDDEETISEYAYDGAKRRILQKTYKEDVLDEVRHLYYTQPSQWQVVEERAGASTEPERQFAWGLRYIDDLVLRDRDANGNGTLDERLYGCQDGNWNVTALVDTTGTVEERFAYSAYGTPLFLSSAFETEPPTYIWETLYCGYRWELPTGLYHVRNRIFIDALGSWVQRDPVEVSGYLRLYEYCYAQPLVYTDPRGLSPVGQACCFLCYGPIAAETENKVRRSGASDRNDLDGGNAFLHCVVSCEVHQQCPICDNNWDAREIPIKKIGDRQDLANNAIGRNVSGDCWKGCMTAWEERKLTCQNSDGSQLVPCPIPVDDYEEPLFPEGLPKGADPIFF